MTVMASEVSRIVVTRVSAFKLVDVRETEEISDFCQELGSKGILSISFRFTVGLFFKIGLCQ